MIWDLCRTGFFRPQIFTFRTIEPVIVMLLPEASAIVSLDALIFTASFKFSRVFKSIIHTAAPELSKALLKAPSSLAFKMTVDAPFVLSPKFKMSGPSSHWKFGQFLSQASWPQAPLAWQNLIGQFWNECSVLWHVLHRIWWGSVALSKETEQPQPGAL